MSDKGRQISERSLENLKLGAESRRQGKLRHNFTILPETAQWLKGTGNSSDAIDTLVEAARTGRVRFNDTHDWKEPENTQSNDVYERKIKELDLSLEETYLELATVRSRLEELSEREKFLTSQLDYCHQDKAKITDLLKPALKFPGNNAAPIKVRIREALSLLEASKSSEVKD